MADDEEKTKVVADLVERFRRLGYESSAALTAREVDAAELEIRVIAVLRDTFGDDVTLLPEDD